MNRRKKLSKKSVKSPSKNSKKLVKDYRKKSNKQGLAALQNYFLGLSLPTKKALRPSISKGADGARIFVKLGKFNKLLGAGALDKSGILHTIVERERTIGGNERFPDFAENSLTFSEDGKSYLRVSVSASWQERAAGMGIASFEKGRIRSFVSLTLSNQSDGVHVTSQSRFNGKVVKNEKVISRVTKKPSKILGNTISGISIEKAFAGEIRKLEYFEKFLDRLGSQAQKSLIADLRRIGIEMKEDSLLRALLESSQGTQSSNGAKFFAISANNINASNAQQVKDEFAAELAAGGVILSTWIPPAAPVIAYGGMKVSSWFNQNVDELVKAQQQAAADQAAEQSSIFYSLMASNLLQDTQYAEAEAEAAMNNGDPAAASYWSDLAQADANQASQAAQEASQAAATITPGSAAAKNAQQQVQDAQTDACDATTAANNATNNASQAWQMANEGSSQISATQEAQQQTEQQTADAEAEAEAEAQVADAMAEAEAEAMAEPQSEPGTAYA